MVEDARASEATIHRGLHSICKVSFCNLSETLNCATFRWNEERSFGKLLSNDTKTNFSDVYLFFRGLNKEELELYTEMKARRDAEDEAKRATESSDEEVVIIMRMRTAFVCMKRK